MRDAHVNTLFLAHFAPDGDRRTPRIEAARPGGTHDAETRAKERLP